jgi:hypothetical protein
VAAPTHIVIIAIICSNYKLEHCKPKEGKQQEFKTCCSFIQFVKEIQTHKTRKEISLHQHRITRNKRINLPFIERRFQTEMSKREEKTNNLRFSILNITTGFFSH